MAICKIKDIAEEISVRVNDPKSSGYQRFVGLEHYIPGNCIIRNFGSAERLDSAVKEFKSGDILIARRNVYLKRAGIVYFDGVTSGDSIVLRAKTKLMQGLLPFILNTDKFWSYANQNADGSMSKRLSPKLLMDFEFSLPENIDKNEELADILWKMESLREAYETQVKASDDLVKSQFIEMFGDFQSNSKGWKIFPFEKFAIIDAVMTTDYEKYADYPHIGIDSIEKDTGALQGYRTVKEDNVISGKYIFTPKHIIYSKIRPNLNKVALPDFDGLCSADAYPILPKEDVCDRYFLATVLRSDYFLSYILGFSARSQMPKVNRKQISGFTMPLPPIQLQHEFAAIMQQTDKSKYNDQYRRVA